MTMNPRGHSHPYLSSSGAIRQEIQRFESVHPSIYAIYDLIEAIPDPLIQQQIREHVVCIEDSFVNSQEWTLSRSVPDLKLGILGTINSGKSALVHRYLTGSYMQEESPEGGRFKKEVVLDGSANLLLIRDEGGPPEMQFTHWVDAVIFVFSLENEMSFNAVYNYYAKMAHYRTMTEIPIILVGTQDAISESNPRVIDDTRARKLANDLKRCSYYETCATYGLNVERVFQDACQKIVSSVFTSSHTPTNSRPSTPNHTTSTRGYYCQHQSQTPQNAASGASAGAKASYDSQTSSSQSTSGSGNIVTAAPTSAVQTIQGHSPPFREQPAPPGSREKERKDTHKHDKKHRDKDKDKPEREQTLLSQSQASHLGDGTVATVGYTPKHPHHSMPVPIPVVPPPTTAPPPVPSMDPQAEMYLLQQQQQQQQQQSAQPTENSLESQQQQQQQQPAGLTPLLGRKEPRYRFSLIVDQDNPEFRDPRDLRDLPTPSSTPTQSRKNRRRSNLFNAVQKKGEEDKRGKNGETVGSGRVIPLKQGYLYKKSSKPLNKEWKKKYVTLLDDGRLTYHSNLHDYMDDVHGKEIKLVRTTVKIPGQRPRAARTVSESTNQANQPNGQVNNVTGKAGKESVTLTGFDILRDAQPASCEDAVVISNASVNPGALNGLDPFTSSSPQVVPITNPACKIETPNVKKRHRRAKSGAKNLDASQDGADSDGYEFLIVSLDNKSWQFEAPTIDDREGWVAAIEGQILCSLQGNESNKSKSKSNTLTDPAAGQAIRSMKGNAACVDCDAPNPDWASLNLGALMCIECSGIHRNLGTHISRVRSLDLDDWPPEMVDVMTSIGNYVANSIWEANTKGRTKPTTASPREEKERWIRAKYDTKEFLPPPPYLDVPLPQQLIDAIARQDVHNTILVLSYTKSEHVNAPYSKTDTRTALHIAAALGNVVLVQLLLWYGANVKMVDHEGRNSLWYARSSSSTECVELLRNQGCPENPTLPRRRGSNQPNNNNENFDKLPASVI